MQNRTHEPNSEERQWIKFQGAPHMAHRFVAAPNDAQKNRVPHMYCRIAGTEVGRPLQIVLRSLPVPLLLEGDLSQRRPGFTIFRVKFDSVPCSSFRLGYRVFLTGCSLDPLVCQSRRKTRPRARIPWIEQNGTSKHLHRSISIPLVEQVTPLQITIV